MVELNKDQQKQYLEIANDMRRRHREPRAHPEPETYTVRLRKDVIEHIIKRHRNQKESENGQPGKWETWSEVANRMIITAYVLMNEELDNVQTTKMPAPPPQKTPSMGSQKK